MKEKDVHFFELARTWFGAQVFPMLVDETVRANKRKSETHWCFAFVVETRKNS